MSGWRDPQKERERERESCSTHAFSRPRREEQRKIHEYDAKNGAEDRKPLARAEGAGGARVR